MSIYAFLLDGWDYASTWGLDGDHYYAQLTPNGVDDADGPQVWIGPPTHLVGTVTEMVHGIAAALDLPLDLVDEAMARGSAACRGEPVMPVPVSGAAVCPPTPFRQPPTRFGPRP
ncbi:hypothetical protein [Pseudonocardia sp. HH130630-07]|uniref:hypothetical protein n=1 Tax=Pseudonocardia sp. HH130630-07 TaxID=1690815 RepID=UPI0012EAABE9|nr:hypothetical protein [Pseudonocardia sp. HH130630-07]